MGNIKDFVISRGVLKEYTGDGGDIIIPIFDCKGKEWKTFLKIKFIRDLYYDNQEMQCDFF